MPQRPVSLEPGRDGNPGRAEEDWLAWCESVEGQLGPDDEEEPEDAAADEAAWLKEREPVMLYR